jgi:hypothetical protein
MNSKINCLCGSTINHNYFRIHIYSKKHIDFISTNPIKDYADCYNEELFYNLNEKMNELDENKLLMNEGEYIDKCNKLLKDYKENKENSLKESYRTLLTNVQKNHRLYKTIISHITYKNNSIIVYQKHINSYFNYYLIDNNLFIMKIDYLNFILNNIRS